MRLVAAIAEVHCFSLWRVDTLARRKMLRRQH